ncbi:MAG: hypothetical protein KDB26_08580 [Microthrixaceae bacterium]|nr:hypothetical protein [Microthrixaceae bacterium]
MNAQTTKTEVITINSDDELVYTPREQAVYLVWDRELNTLSATVEWKANASYLSYPRGVRDDDAGAEVFEGFPAVDAEPANRLLADLAALIDADNGDDSDGWGITMKLQEELANENEAEYDDCRHVRIDYADAQPDPRADFPTITAESTDVDIDVAVSEFVEAFTAAGNRFIEESTVTHAVHELRDELRAEADEADED